MKRVDFTYWPETQRVEWHGHDDDKGDTPALAVPPIVAADALGRLTRQVLAHYLDSVRPATKPRGCG